MLVHLQAAFGNRPIANWTPLSDDLPQIGVSGIAIDPNDSNTIYIATGDDDAGDSIQCWSHEKHRWWANVEHHRSFISLDFI